MESRREKASRLANLYGYAVRSKYVDDRSKKKYLASAGKQLLREDMDNPRLFHEQPIYQTIARTWINHPDRWNFGSKLPEQTLHPIPTWATDQHVVPFKDAPHTWRHDIFRKLCNPLGGTSPYTKEAMGARASSPHMWATQRLPHKFNPDETVKVPVDEVLQRIFYAESRTKVEKARRLEELKKSFEKETGGEGRDNVYQPIKVHKRVSKSEQLRPLKQWHNFTVLVNPTQRGAGMAFRNDDDSKRKWRWPEARYFLGKIRRAQRPRAGMDNIQILIEQFKQGMEDVGVAKNTWIVKRDQFAKIILSKYSGMDQRSVNRLYSSLDTEYTDQVDFRSIVGLLTVVQLRQAGSRAVLSKLFNTLASLYGNGNEVLPLDDICLVLSTCCPDSTAEQFITERTQIQLRTKFDTGHEYSWKDLLQFFAEERKMANTWDKYFDDVVTQLTKPSTA